MLCRCTVFIGWRFSVLRSFITGIAANPVSTGLVEQADIPFDKSTTRAGLWFGEDLDTGAYTLLNEDSDILLEELNIGSGFIKLQPADAPTPTLKHKGGEQAFLSWWVRHRGKPFAEIIPCGKLFF